MHSILFDINLYAYSQHSMSTIIELLVYEEKKKS